MVIGGMITSVLFLLGYMWKEAHSNRVRHVTLSFPHFPIHWPPLTIFFISDIHRRIVSSRMLENVKGKADLVVIGGDLAERGVPEARVRENVRRLQAVAPVYFVWGNNDDEVDYDLQSLLEEERVHVLKNKAKVWEHGGVPVALIGVGDVSRKEADIDRALECAPPQSFRILACHNPAIIGRLRDEQRISLVLSGHTHGGQIRLFSLGLYEKGGLKWHGNTALFTSNGYGTTGVPLRLGAPAETHLITIVPGKTTTEKKCLSKTGETM
ncbi:metallophosphoesterase [Geobacillus subterraneus]|uniref:Metallophosphoesterase n=2 Tax=Geobacillus TaxID=129337 RepID=A0ABN4NEQ5_9BACL|nr:MULTISPECIES: metallophosphoesterase [Geobacillus]AMX83073.1 metallophosphoesterase [Geobacillus subterraneus]KZS27018.1 metallophosphoesterase [Geobacillus subterraneus]OXB91167.1 metallophosphoesterase [Geobacillus uzenensis]